MSAADDVARAMAEIVESTKPILEAAAGMRTQMVRDGWTEESAEKIATEFVLLAFSNMRAVR